jgi:hypothetical protein
LNDDRVCVETRDARHCSHGGTAGTQSRDRYVFDQLFIEAMHMADYVPHSTVECSCAIVPRRRFWLIAAIGILVAPVLVNAADRDLYFSKSPDYAPLATTPLVVQKSDSIEFELVLRTLSVEDRTQFPDLVTEDYRFDVSKYYQDHRVPNVRFEVEEVAGDNTVRPASYRLSSRGGGVDLKYLTADVSFELGRFQTTYRLIDHLWYVGALLFAPHARGTYQIRAIYREFVTPTVRIIVK